MVLLNFFFQHDMVEQRFHAVVSLLPRVLCDEKVNAPSFKTFHIAFYHVIPEKMEVLQVVFLKIFSQNVRLRTERDAVPHVGMLFEECADQPCVFFLFSFGRLYGVPGCSGG